MAVRAACGDKARLVSVLRWIRRAIGRLVIDRAVPVDPGSVHLLHVARLYWLVLGRFPDPDGLRHHAQLLASAHTLVDLATSLLQISGSGSGRRESAAQAVRRRAGGRLGGFKSAWRSATRLPKRVAWLVRHSSGDDDLLATWFPDGIDPERAEAGPAWAYRVWAAAIDEVLDRLVRRNKILLGLLGPKIVLTMQIDPGTPAAKLDKTVAALARQRYARWRLLLGGTLPAGWAVPPDFRIVSGAGSRAAAGSAQLVGVLRPGDVLAPSCLATFALATFRRPLSSAWSCDEDRIDEGGRRFAPTLHCGGGLVLRRRSPLLGRCATRHLPAVLLHRADTATDPGALPALARQGLASASLVIVTRDRPALLRRCLDSIQATTQRLGSGNGPEIVVVDNGTKDPEALRILDRCRDQGGIVLRRPAPFNWSALCNHGVRASSGAVVVLMNNDVECIRPDWLPHLLSACADPSVGVVGARLLFADGRVQHNGVMVGPGPVAAHRLDGSDGPGNALRPVSAVTGACMAFRRVVFDRLGGLEEALPVTWNDLDFCFRAREAGLSVQLATGCVLRHDELGTRTPDTAPENREQMARTMAFVAKRHRRALRRDLLLHPFLALVTRARLLDPNAPKRVARFVARGGFAWRVD